MKTIKIEGKSPIYVSEIICGTAHYGHEITPEDSFKLLDVYYEDGGRTIDTARIYGRMMGGVSLTEQCIGNWLKERGIDRSSVTIITKGCHPDFSDLEKSRVGARFIDEDVSGSLEDLWTDYIDVYQLHRDDPNVAVAEIIESMNGHLRAGRIRSLSASNWTAERIKEANDYARAKGLVGFASSEINFSLAKLNAGCKKAGLLNAGDEDLAFYAHENMPILAWGALAGGIIIKIAEDKGNRASMLYQGEFGNAVTYCRAENMKKVMRETGLTATQLSVLYVTRNPACGAAIIGPKTVEHMRACLAAADVEIGADVIAALTEGTMGAEGEALLLADAADKPYDLSSTIGAVFGEERNRGVIAKYFGDVTGNQFTSMAEWIPIAALLELPIYGANVSKERLEQMIAELNEIKRQ
jgi:aryl-alcohol dehydrogenase-like predicted oxidoreductase